MRSDWSQLEVEAVVADYFAMFAKELARQPYSKTEHRRSLAKLLNSRSEGSIEFKHQNISAVLLDFDYFYIPGYKPRSNYQQLLADVVVDHLLRDRGIEAAIRHAAEAPVLAMEVSDPLDILVSAPTRRDRTYAQESHQDTRPRVRAQVNYLEREAQNASLGLAGERLILAYEYARLLNAGLPSLAHRVEHTALVDGDGAGFDIRSFEIDGTDRLIEVKTTGWGNQTPFFVTRNELAVSRERSDCYHLYRLFEARKSPRLFTVAGALDQSFDLDAVQYLARIA